MTSRFSRGRAACLAAIALAVITLPAIARAAEPDGDDDDDDGPAKPVTELIVQAHRLDAARANVEPDLGASTYSLANEAVEARPGGETTSINEVLLQVPGVQQDGSGQLHVRQSQGDLQYRINNVIIPEGVSDLGESISARVADRVELVTGALPAQYGFQAGGVVNITTKNGVYLSGGQAELYGGGEGEIEPAFEYGTSLGAANVFVSGSFLRNRAGSASRDGSADPNHDRTDQVDGFAFIDRPLDADTRVSLILSLSDDRFQDPNLRGQLIPPVPPTATYQGPLSVDGVSAYPSEGLGDDHREATRFGIASLIHTAGPYTVQASAFVRQSVADNAADGIGDLLYKGMGLASFTRDLAYGLQVEGVYEAGKAHTLRAGLVASADTLASGATTRVLAVDAQGRETSDIPETLSDAARQQTSKTSAFVQDEWRLTGSLTFNTGLRLDAVSGPRRETALSPRWSAVWKPLSGTTLHLGYARYFLPAPAEDAEASIADLIGTTGAAPGVRADALRSERDDYFDVGAQQVFGKLTLSIDAYWRAASDLIAEGWFGPAYVPHAFNYAAARLRGVELGATYAAGPVSAWANVAAAQSEGRGVVSNQAYFTTAQLADLGAWRPLAQDQAVVASAGGSYKRGALRLSGQVLFGSGLPRTAPGLLVNGAHLPPNVQADFAVVYTVGQGGKRPLDLRIDLINAFDARYQLRDGAGLGDGAPQWGARRGVFVGLEQSF
jgi:outer membrane cobalamin receptor